jgi:thiol-disulfide isomerase/thioredoxin
MFADNSKFELILLKMKNTVLGLLGVLFVLASCKEKAPPINFGNVSGGGDTTYVLTTVPAADAHNILIEEFTGQSCSNCPAAHTDLENLSNQYPGRLNIIGLYITNFSQTTPPNGATHDFRDSLAAVVGNVIYGGIGSMPGGGVDRILMPTDATILLSRGTWPSAIAQQVNVVDSVNLAVKSVYNAAAGTSDITYTVTYVKPVSYPNAINIAVVEDSITDLQEFPGTVQSYLYTNVFRSFVTAVPYGDAFLGNMATKEAGRVWQHTYHYTLKQGAVAEHCRVIAYITNTANNKVMQSVQTKLTGS